MSMVEMVGVEPTSESISAGISPSAVNVLKVSLFPTSINRLRKRLSRKSPAVPGAPAEFSCIVDAGNQAYR